MKLKNYLTDHSFSTKKKVFRKTSNFYCLKLNRTCASKGVIKVSFSEYFSPHKTDDSLTDLMCFHLKQKSHL